MKTIVGKLLGGAFAYRRLTRVLERIDGHLSAQNDILLRLVDRLAPVIDAPAADAGDVSFVSDEDLALGLAYVQRTQEQTGHTPTEEEVLEYLADEKTKDLHTRMNERAASVERGR